MKEETSQTKFQETVSRDGFFKSYFKNFRECFTMELMSAFSNLKSDEDRIKMIVTFLPECKEVGPEISSGKDLMAALELKDKGNAFFVKGDTHKALEAYSESVLKVPFSKESSTEYAVILANRSAALYHLERFSDTIQDINFALKMAYPKELRYKVLERKAKSLLALKKHEEAVSVFRSTLQALDDSKLQTEKKLKIQNDIQIMLNVLTKPKTKQGRINALVEGQKSEQKGSTVLPAIEKKNAQYPVINEKVEILEGEEVGRYAAARTYISAGEIVAVEKAYCSVLLMEQTKNHCQHCFKRTMCPYPCDGCSVAIFCSPSCLDAASLTYHKYECDVVNSLYRSGASVTVLMALRIIAQKQLQHFLDLKMQLKEPRQNRKTYKSDDYLSVYHLVCHEHLRRPEDYLERTVMAIFLLRCLQMAGYFGQKEKKMQGRPLADEEVFIGSLILRHLQLMQFNAHEIAELELDVTESMDKAKSIFIGGGLFPTLALFNHSCDPAVVRYFVGTSVVVKTVRPVDEGDLLAENYGPIFTMKGKEIRQRELKGRYWFECGCKPCSDEWPLLAEMKRKIMRFRCNPSEGGNCPGVLEVPNDTVEFMPKCNLCGKHTNILKSLKALQETDIMFRQASMDTERSKFKAALNIYLEILNILHVHLKPPFYDYHVCQESVRKCILSLGNKYIKDI